MWNVTWIAKQIDTRHQVSMLSTDLYRYLGIEVDAHRAGEGFLES